MPAIIDTPTQNPTPPTLPSTITSSSIAPVTSPITPVTPPVDKTDYSGIISGVASGVGALTDASAAARANQNTTANSIETLMTQLAGKTADTQDAYNAPGGVTDINTQLTNLNSQAKQLQAEASAIPIQTQERNSNTGATDAGVAPQNAGALRLNALKALSIGQQADIATANYTTAKAKADQIIALKYQPMEDQLAALQKQYDLNKDNLDEIDKNKSTALQTAITEQTQNLAYQKQQEKDASDTVQTLLQGGMPSSMAANLQGQTKAQILSTPGVDKYLATGNYTHFTDPLTGQTVIYNTKTGKAAGSFGGNKPGDPNAVGALPDANTASVKAGDSLYSIAQANGTDVATLQKLNPNIQTTNGVSQINPGDKIILPPKDNPNASYQQYGLLTKTNFNPKNMTDANAVRYLNQFLQGNTPSARTLGLTGAALTLAANRASQLYSAATGDPLPPNPDLLKTNTQLISANNKLLNNLNVQESTITKNFGLNLENLKANNLNTAVPVINGIFNSINTALGSPGTAQYNLQNSTLQNEAGSLMAVKNASGTTVYDKMVGAGLIPANATKDQQAAMMKTLLQEALNAQKSISGVNSDLYKTIDPLQMNPDNPNRQAYQTQQKLGPLNFSTSTSSGPDLSTFNFKLQ